MILLLIKVPPPITGATQMNLRVYNSILLNNSFELDSICMSYANNLSDLGAFRYKKFVLVIKYCYELIKKLVIPKYSLVYFQISPYGTAFFRDMLYVLILKLSRVKIVYHLHGKGIKLKSQKNFVYRYLYRFAFKNASILIVSSLLKYDIEKVHYGKVYIVPLGIPDIVLPPKPLSLMKSDLTILFLSNLFIFKGIYDFIDAVEILTKKGINIKAIIVGAEGDLKSKDLADLIEEKKLSRIIEYLGPLYDKEKLQILQMTDILVFPTLDDIWGIVNLEAMQFGIPVIGTNEGAIPEIIDDGRTGYIIEKNRPDQIAQRVELLFNNRSLIPMMGQAGRKKYEEKFTLEIFEQNMKNVFDSILKNKIVE